MADPRKKADDRDRRDDQFGRLAFRAGVVTYVLLLVAGPTLTVIGLAVAESRLAAVGVAVTLANLAATGAIIAAWWSQRGKKD